MISKYSLNLIKILLDCYKYKILKDLKVHFFKILIRIKLKKKCKLILAKIHYSSKKFFIFLRQFIA